MQTDPDTRRDRTSLNIFAAGTGAASLVLPVVGLRAGVAEFVVALVGVAATIWWSASWADAFAGFG